MSCDTDIVCRLGVRSKQQIFNFVRLCVEGDMTSRPYIAICPMCHSYLYLKARKDRMQGAEVVVIDMLNHHHDDCPFDGDVPCVVVMNGATPSDLQRAAEDIIRNMAEHIEHCLEATECTLARMRSSLQRLWFCHES